MSSHPLTTAHLRHLAERAVSSMRARPLSPREESEVAALLDDRLAELFWDQPTPDQRHGIEAARAVLYELPGAREAAQAALLHDVGKRHARLGTLGRIVATVLAILRIPTRGRLGMYLDHATLGADDLAAAGASDLVVDYTRHQDGLRPQSIDAGIWRVLKAADGESHRVPPAAQYDGGDAERS